MTKEELIRTGQDLVAGAQRIVFVTGAGISTAAGIPDFRGPNGLWTKNPKAERLAHIDHYLNDPEVRELAWQARLSSAAWEARPTAAHRAITAVHERRQMLALVTQNVDGLHQAAGTPADGVIEVHGTMHWSICWTCGDRLAMSETLRRVVAGEPDPDCLVCRAAGRNGILKSDTISFGQNLVPEVIDRAFRVAADCDLLIAVGSTLQVYPVAGVVPEARRHGASVIIVNGAETGMDTVANLVIRDDIQAVLPHLLSVEG